MVGGGALGDLAVGADPELDRLPVVADETPWLRRSGPRAGSPSRRSRSSTGRRGSRPRSPEQSAPAGRSPPSRQSITWTKAVTGQAGVAAHDQAAVGPVAAARVPAASEVDRQPVRAVLERERRHVLPDDRADLAAVGGDQVRFVPAGIGDRRRAEDPRGDGLGDREPGEPHSGGEQGEEDERGQQQQPDPLDRPLASLGAAVEQAAQLIGDRIGLLFEASVGESDDPVPGGSELGIAGAIPLESGPVAVIGVAVHLDHQASRRPESVDLVAEDEDVGCRGRETVLLAEDDEAILERRDGRGRLPGGLDQRPEATQAAAAMTPRTELLEG